SAQMLVPFSTNPRSKVGIERPGQVGLDAICGSEPRDERVLLTLCGQVPGLSRSPSLVALDPLYIAGYRTNVTIHLRVHSTIGRRINWMSIRMAKFSLCPKSS